MILQGPPNAATRYFLHRNRPWRGACCPSWHRPPIRWEPLHATRCSARRADHRQLSDSRSDHLSDTRRDRHCERPPEDNSTCTGGDAGPAGITRESSEDHEKRQ